MPERFKREKVPKDAHKHKPETVGHPLPEAQEGVPLEIELKFIVKEVPREIQQGILEGKYRYHVISQGYLRPVGKAGKTRNVRMREVWSPELGVEHRLTDKKSITGIVRHEHEIGKVDEEGFKSLWEMTEGKRVRKIRFYVPYQDSTGKDRQIELDVFLGDLTGLVLAEVEFAHESEAHDFRDHIPKWFGKDVSGVKQYKNSYLANHGLSRKKLGKRYLQVQGISWILDKREKEAEGLLDVQ